MSRDMRKIPLGTHFTPIGNHPEFPENRDQTPSWLMVTYSAFLIVASVFFVREYVFIGVVSKFYIGMFTFSYGTYALLHAKFNWKNKVIRYFDLISLVVYIGIGLALISKP